MTLDACKQQFLHVRKIVGMQPEDYLFFLPAHRVWVFARKRYPCRGRPLGSQSHMVDMLGGWQHQDLNRVITVVKGTLLEILFRAVHHVIVLQHESAFPPTTVRVPERASETIYNIAIGAIAPAGHWRTSFALFLGDALDHIHGLHPPVNGGRNTFPLTRRELI